MAFQFRAPNIAGTMPEPYVAVPESGRSHATQIGLMSALFTSQKLLANWRDHQNATAQANAYADILENEGMKAEADLYRASAQKFKMNFFSDPSSAQNGRDRMLNDALSLLTKKREAESREEMARLRGQMTDYQEQNLDLKRKTQEDSHQLDIQRLENASTQAQAAADRANTAHERLMLQKEKDKVDAELARSKMELEKKSEEQKVSESKSRESLNREKEKALREANDAKRYAATDDGKAKIAEWARKNGLEVDSIDDLGRIKYTNPKTKKSGHVTLKTDGLGGWSITQSGLSPEEADALLKARSEQGSKVEDSSDSDFAEDMKRAFGF